MSNIFAEMGFSAEDAQVLALKSDLARLIRESVAGQRQTDIARKLSLSQSDVSKIMRGSLNAISLERLVRVTIRAGLNLSARWGKEPDDCEVETLEATYSVAPLKKIYLEESVDCSGDKSEFWTTRMVEIQ